MGERHAKAGTAAEVAAVGSITPYRDRLPPAGAAADLRLAQPPAGLRP